MRNKPLRKNIFREIRSTGGRFLAIFAIAALGAGFFAGLRATGPNMRATADAYYTGQNLMDLRLLSTYGFTPEDVQALQSQPGVESVMPTQGLDVLVDADGGEEVARLHALPSDTGAQNNSYLNRLVLTEGRMPQKADECVLDARQSAPLGSVVRLAQDNPDTALERVNGRSFTVVGKAQSPYYISMQRGNTSIGGGRIGFFVYLPQNAFNNDVYTEILLRANGTAGLSSFEGAYVQAVDAEADNLAAFGQTRTEVRYREVYNENAEKLDDARTELATARREAQEELASARAQIEEGEAELADARVQIADAAQQVAEGENAIQEATQALADGQAALDAGRSEYSAQRQKYDEGLALYTQKNNEYNEALAQYEENRAAFDAQYTPYLQAVAEYESAYAALQGFSGALEGLNGYTNALQGYLATIQNGTPEEQQAATEAFTQTAGAAMGMLQTLAEGLQAAGLPDAATAVQGAAEGAAALLGAGQYAEVIAAIAAVPGALQPALADKQAQLDAVKVQLDEAGAPLEAAKAELDAGKAQLDEAATQLAATRQQLEEGKTALDDARAQLSAGQTQLTEGAAMLEQKRGELAEGRAQLSRARTQLAEGEAELADAKTAYEEGEAETAQKLEDAQSEIDQNQQELDELEPPEWYVLTREANPGYTGFASDTDRISAIASMIPVFFFLVAALVCLTTMTRMVEEQRTQIGTLKALGFGPGAIAFKYLFYAASASTAGAVLGVLVGSYLFPTAIWGAYSILYTMPQFVLRPNWGLALFSVAATVLCTSLATLAACFAALRSVPAQLMRPRAPRAGKRVLLERIPFIWNRMGFNFKVTARNLFRYKKRFFMTVIGVAGCTALLLTGFGLRDAITGIVDMQYGGIMQYHMAATLQNPASAQDNSRLNDKLPTFGSSLYAQQSLVDVAAEGRTNNGMTTYAFVPEDTQHFSQFISLRTRVGQTPIPFPQEGQVVITEKVATRLGVGAGDEIQINLIDEAPVAATIAAVAENYVLNYVYMAPATYSGLFGKEAAYTDVFITLPQGATAGTQEMLAALIDTENVAGAVDLTDLSGEMNDILGSLNAVVWLIIAAAGLLAFVVLYNLTNINITERAREIATLKVLGFHRGEVASYVYRENIVLTLLGIGLGLILGVFLHQFVIQTAEVDEVMFRRVIQFLSYVWATLFTLLSAGLVNLVMLPKLKKIDMVESLKSAE